MPSIDAINSIIDSIWASINAAQSVTKSIVVPSSKTVNSTVNNSSTRNFNVK
ncbi:hypothetical protein [Faecalimicrobium sp. JNUCC 81]